MAAKRARKLTIRRVPINSIHPDPANARTHGDRNLEALRASLTHWGQVEDRHYRGRD